jgi:hypothetical protein
MFLRTLVRATIRIAVWTAVWATVLGTLPASSLSAAEQGTGRPGPGAEPPAGEAVSFNIRYYDRRIYHVESDPVYVQITITNNSPETYRFKLADDRSFSVDFDIRTMTNRALEMADRLVRRRTESQQVFFREITVESGESFSFVEDLRDFVKFGYPGSFVVRARMYPELYRNAGAGVSGAAPSPVLESNRLNLNLRPPAIPGPGGVPLAMDTETGAVLVREKLAPDQVVEYLIRARQTSQWEKYFLYLDLEAMIARDPARNRRWLAEGEEGRRRMIARYRTELESAVIDGDISTIPTRFTIERTNYNSFEGTVTVLEEFRTANYTERKRYTYYLNRRDDIWTVVDYSVVNLGTAASE